MGIVIRFPAPNGTSCPEQTSTAGAALRARICAEIEERLVILDALDGDCDFEPDADGEASLGWSLTAAIGTGDDREEDASPVERTGGPS